MSLPRKIFLLAIVGFCAFAAYVIYYNAKEIYYYEYSKWYPSNMRQFAIEMRNLASVSAGLAPGDSYWGPLTTEKLKSMGLNPDAYIDPFNPETSGGPLRSSTDKIPNPYIVWPTVRGGDYQFYSDGKGFWMIIGRGPDGKLDFTKEIIDIELAEARLQPGKQLRDPPPPSFSALTYDPMNGVPSAGDFWRVVEPY